MPKIRHEEGVVHLVAQRLFDFSAELSALGERNSAVSMPHGRGDEFANGTTGSPDSRTRPQAGIKQDTMITPETPVDRLRVRSRNFQ